MGSVVEDALIISINITDKVVTIYISIFNDIKTNAGTCTCVVVSVRQILSSKQKKNHEFYNVT